MRYSESNKVFIKSLLELNSLPGAYGQYMQDVLLVDHENSCTPMPHNAVLQRYENFKKFEVVKDFSDHLFVKHMAQGKPVIRNEIHKEWDVIKKDLPDGIYVRAYESRHDLLTAVIIGQQGTPYQDGLFVFDLVIPISYPSNFGPPPLVRYHSSGLQISPNIYTCGQVLLSRYRQNNQGCIETEDMWLPGTSNLVQVLVFIRDIYLSKNPLSNHISYRNCDGSLQKQRFSFLYKENIVIKSLKTMVHTMTKPPKNFEDLVFGHFRSCVRDILMTCKGYMEGKFIEGIFDERCSIAFRNDVASCIKPLVDAFIRIGAQEAQGFLYLSLLVQNTKENLNNSYNHDTNTSAHGEDNSIQEVNETLRVPNRDWHLWATMKQQTSETEEKYSFIDRSSPQ